MTLVEEEDGIREVMQYVLEAKGRGEYPAAQLLTELAVLTGAA